MAKPRVFISSTYYDLKHIRSSLDIFIESLGFEPVLSEKGDIAYAPDAALDESCYREVGNCDVFVLIIGGRYGSPASDQDAESAHDAIDRYDSITKKEYDRAAERGLATYILIDNNVYAEYRTYLRNKDNTDISYAHVSSPNIFRLVEAILAKPKNNPVHTFERASEIEAWLREQWAGLFRELLQRMTSQQQLATLSAQVTELKEVSDTLRKYLEAVMTEAPRDDRIKLIESEEERLRKLEQREKISQSPWYRYVDAAFPGGLPIEDFINAITESRTFTDFQSILGKAGGSSVQMRISHTLSTTEGARSTLNEIREILGLSPLG